jgi:hypothetical protein
MVGAGQVFYEFRTRAEADHAGDSLSGPMGKAPSDEAIGKDGD